MRSAKDIQKRLKDDHGIEIKEHKLINIMHQELGAKYKKIVHVSWQANSPKNLVLR